MSRLRGHAVHEARPGGPLAGREHPRRVGDDRGPGGDLEALPKQGHILYILDEPTTGLHYGEVRQLIDVLNQLVDAGNTVLVVEHNMELVKTADYVIDMGPEGGEAGGRVVAAGTPEQIAACPESYTGRFLKELLERYEEAMG
ncbi:MAG: hypothetical protein K8I02_10085 [Candidatus Methylomirabilis sp.]|nr:hypothetical protein [Deltaproteobacteria bacterium]